MDLFDIAIKAGAGLNILAFLTNILICFKDGGESQMHRISIQSRLGGAAYIVCAWFMGNGGLVSSGRSTYEEVVHVMFMISLGWLAVYLFSVFSLIWSKGEKLSKKALVTAMIYFILSFLLK